MVGIEGQIQIDLYPSEASGSGLEQVKISSTRPFQASQILIGKTPDNALSIVPLLFSICGIAQSRASLLAIEQKKNIEADLSLEAARDLLVLAENSKEHLLRISIDWPRLFDLRTRNKDLSYLSQISKEFKEVLFKKANAFGLKSKFTEDYDQADQLIDQLEEYLEENIFISAIDKWLDHDATSLYGWAKRSRGITAKTIQVIYEKEWGSEGAAGYSPLPELEAEALLSRFKNSDAEQFIAQPTWENNCHESTTLSRQFDQPLIQDLHNTYSSGLLTRWVARLVELARIPDQMRQLMQLVKSQDIGAKLPLRLDIGVSQVEAARGRLIHRVEVEDNQISQYQILAPTEWNFHPEGLLNQCLSQINAENNNERAQLAHLLINAIDPCVGYTLNVH